MSMTLARPGQANNAGDSNALYLRKFGGEVLTAFKRKTAFIERHLIRTIENGQSASFPATWRATARYHTPGTQITGQTMAHNERVIVIDDLLIADTFVYKLDDAKNHYDVRSIYSNACGEALATSFDRNVARVGVLAARASATVSGANGGTIVTSATSKTSANDLVTAIGQAAQALDEKDVPEDDRYIYLRPAQYTMLVSSGHEALSQDMGNGGNGSVSSGKIYRLHGMEIVKTNALPITNESAVADIPAAYRVNASTTSALVTHKSATGTVKLLDLSVEMDYMIDYQGWLHVAKYAIGHGILRPECAVEVRTGAPV